MTAQASKFQYKPEHKPNQLICGVGQTALITGWTVKQAIAKRLNDQEFAVIGNLYSATRGINFLIRNLLANPHVRFLVILNATKEDKNAGSGECLLDLFANGFEEGYSDSGRPCWVIKSSIPGYIDIEIEHRALEKLRHSIEWQEAKSISDAVSKVKSYAQKGVVESWGEPLEFPIFQVIPTVLPGTRYGHRIEGKTIAETWVKIIHRIKTTGTIRPTGYDGQWQELIDLMAVVTDEPEGFYFPEPNYLPVNPSLIEEYIKQILDNSQLREEIKYTYGQRLRSGFGCDQIQQVIQKLIADIDSARAVMSLWDVKQDHQANSPPCLNHIWVRVVDRELSLSATFRSNDMFSAWPANAIGLRALQRYIKEEIVKGSDYDLKLGPLITISQSAHIYDDCWENASQLIQSQYVKITQQRDYQDPAGSFVISVSDYKIVVEHLTPGSGEVINCYSGKSAKQLYQQIAVDCPSLQVEHAIYLGTELQKAEMAATMKQDVVYEQDKELKRMKREKVLQHSLMESEIETFRQQEEKLETKVLKIKLLNEKAKLPQSAHQGDAGLDLFATSEVVIKPGESSLISTGISIGLPPQTEAQIRPRSGLALKHQVTVLNTPGTIDQGYRGEIGVILINHGKSPFQVEIGMKIAQMVIKPVLSVQVKSVEELDETDRGVGGFGSTGR